MGMQAEKGRREFSDLFLKNICDIIVELIASRWNMHNKDRMRILFICIIQLIFMKAKLGTGVE